jgi:hypothetical protein
MYAYFATITLLRVQKHGFKHQPNVTENALVPNNILCVSQQVTGI